MENENMKKCPYCAEMIKAEAIKCRYCGSNLSKKGVNLDFLTTPGYWHRVNEGKKIAGVCTGLAHQFDALIIIMPLRLFFILTTIFYGFGIILYALLWLLMSPPIDTAFTKGEQNDFHPVNTKKKKPEPSEQSDDNSSKIEDKNTSDTEKETSGNYQEEGTQEKPEDNSPSERSKINYLLGIVILFTGTIIILKTYMLTLKTFLNVTLQPSFLFSGFILAGSLVIVIGGALYFKKRHISLAGKY